MPSMLPSPIEQSIDRVAEQHASPQLLTIPVLSSVQLGPGGSLMVSVSPAGEVPMLLVDVAEQGWHPVVLAPGSRWELREVKDGADLWTPGAEHG
jgi:hypothetical protein